MTSKQKASIKHNIKQKYTKGELAYYEYNDLVEQLQVLFDNGATLQEANAALGLTKAGKKAAAAAQTAPAATPAQAATGMTQAEYNAKKSEMYKKYKAGEITNYAYIQWKKQNDPSKNPAASTSAAGASASTGTPMTIEEKQELKQLLHDMADNGTINAFEYSDKLNWLIHNQMKVSAQEAKVALGIATPAQSGTGSASSPDPGTVAAQQAESEIEKKLKKVYKQAQKEIKEKLKDWEDKHQAKDAEMLAKLNAGEITQAQYDAWKKNALATGNIWKQKLDQVSGVLLDANQQAMAIINGEKMGVFAENANFAAYQLTQDTGMNLSFAIYDADAVGNLIKNEPELLPRKVVNGKKDKAWNQKKMANAVTQGIIQGESIPELANRIARDTASDNMNAMMRYARTAMTGAQNAGRMHTMERAQGMGIGLKKKWLCTLDNRTRDWHQELDGQVQDIDKPFVNALGEIMYPGDPDAAAGNVYNCRCTLIYDYEDYPNDPEFDQRYDQEDDEVLQYMTYEEWEDARSGNQLNDLNQAKVSLAQTQKAVIAAKIKEDKVYSDIWKEDVTLADYPAKKGSIQGKRDYYTAEIAKLEDAIAKGQSWATEDKVKELKKKLKLLNEYEKNGQLIEARDAALAKVQGIYDQVGYEQTAAIPATATAEPKAKKAAKSAAGAASPSGGANGGASGQTGAQGQTAGKQSQFAPDAWDAKTKKAAPFYAKRGDADKYLRKELDAMWNTLTDEEKYAVWQYTRNSNPMNKRLSGYGDTSNWSRTAFEGFGNTEWGLEDTWRSGELASAFRKFGVNGHPDFHKVITALTKAIDKSSIGQNMFVKRQGGPGDFAGMMEGGGFKFDTIMKLFDGKHSTAELEKALVGQKGKNNAFTSTGIAKDAIWSGNIYYTIYVPKGTHAIYAEPQSHYGNSMGGQDKLYKVGSSFSGIGSEAEIIMQRGTEYRITGIKQRGSGVGASWEVEMEIVGQPDYFKYGDEDTYNDGQTRHKK